MLEAIHRILGIIFMGATAVLAIWGYVFYRRKQPLSDPYWRAQRGCAALLVIEICLGLSFLATGHRPRDPLHLMYAGLATVGIGASEMLRPRSSFGRILREEGRFSEAGAYAVLNAVVSLLTLRLWMTG